MKNRTYIEKFVELIIGEFDETKNDNGFVERSFFESVDLKEKVSNDAGLIFKIMKYPALSDDKFERLYTLAIKESKHLKQSGMAQSIGLNALDDKKKDWLDIQRIETIGWNKDELKTYRQRYIAYLSSIGRNKNYIEETKRSSLDIVKKLGDPDSDYPFYVRGLVVGSVQSGKTANFNAVINSAIDVGYGLIIVLSGIMEDLRVQTQRRIEKEVEGKFENGVFIGVGEVSSFGDSAYALHKDVKSISVPTSVDTDFKKSIKEADFSLNNRNILVCKKNTNVLKNLLLWLQNYLNENKDKIRVPLLILDDEADNASLNNLGDKGMECASIINGHIRALLGLFEKKTYLGYTATPFGNVLQDRHDAPSKLWTINDGGTTYEFEQTASLFPHDFIELLFPPPNYIGAKHFFETSRDDIKKIDPLIAPVVNDTLNVFPERLDKETEKPTRETGKGTRAANKYDDYPKHLPRSLEEAIMCFIISTAIRISRKKTIYESKLYQPHNTMLIHISRFITWQSKTKELVVKYIDELEQNLQNDNPQDSSLIYGEFEGIWNKYYAYIVSNIWIYLPDDYEDEFLIEKSFVEIKSLLITAVQNVEIKAINSNPPKDKLIYPDDSEKTYIAIGGNRLSRGFTLEGLTVNYFIRNTNYADTLLQMGRWFGYRPGYIDCCKLFTTQGAIEKFDQTSLTIEDVEQKFIDMNRDPLNTPEKYALRVLTHPGVLKVTRDSILKNAEEIKFSYSDHLIQTKKFKIDNEIIKKAWGGFCSHISSISDKIEYQKGKNGKTEYITYEVQDISDLFDFFALPNSFSENELQDVQKFIESCNEKDKLTNWTIAIKVSGNGRELDTSPMGIETSIRRIIRSGPGPEQEAFLYQLKNQCIFSAGGKSANIFSGGKDFQIRLGITDIEEAESAFKANKFEELITKYPDMSEKEIRERVERVTIPEKVYRQKMSDKEGVLIIYLMDLYEVFRYGGKDISELDELKSMVDIDIPLIGFAVGIPPVAGDIGANYLQSKFHVEELPTDDDEYEDYEEVLNEY